MVRQQHPHVNADSAQKPQKMSVLCLAKVSLHKPIAGLIRVTTFSQKEPHHLRVELSAIAGGEHIVGPLRKIMGRKV